MNQAVLFKRTRLIRNEEPERIRLSFSSDPRCSHLNMLLKDNGITLEQFNLLVRVWCAMLQFLLPFFVLFCRMF